MSSKIREAISRLVREIEDGMLVELSSKFEHDLAKSLLADVKSALAEPSRNCDVGSVDEQFKRHCNKWCRKMQGFMCLQSLCSECYAKWSQMPYEEGESK